jgi:hypothetical protein
MFHALDMEINVERKIKIQFRLSFNNGSQLYYGHV